MPNNKWTIYADKHRRLRAITNRILFLLPPKEKRIKKKTARYAAFATTQESHRLGLKTRSAQTTNLTTMFGPATLHAHSAMLEGDGKAVIAVDEESYLLRGKSLWLRAKNGISRRDVACYV